MTLRCSAARVLLTGLLTIALLPSGGRGQGTRATNIPKPIRLKPDDAIPIGQRTDAFRRLLFEFHFTPIRSAEDLLAKPDKSILIVLGDLGPLANEQSPQGLAS